MSPKGISFSLVTHRIMANYIIKFILRGLTNVVQCVCLFMKCRMTVNLREKKAVLYSGVHLCAQFVLYLGK